MIAVCDASPLIGLSKGGRLEILYQAFPKVLIPTLVYHEVVTKGGRRFGVRSVANAIRSHYMRVISVTDARLIPPRLLGTGEGKAIALCREIRQAFLIADDRVAQMEAGRLKIPWVSTITVVEEAKRQGFIRRARPLFDRMISRGFGISDYEALLEELNER